MPSFLFIFIILSAITTSTCNAAAVDHLLEEDCCRDWANLIIEIGFSLPANSTVLVPTTNFNTAFLDPERYIKFHTIPLLITFEDFLQFSDEYRLPTLLPGHFLVISNTPPNFTINGVYITHPNLFLSHEVAIHGLSTAIELKSPPRNNPNQRLFLQVKPLLRSFPSIFMWLALFLVIGVIGYIIIFVLYIIPHKIVLTINKLLYRFIIFFLKNLPGMGLAITVIFFVLGMLVYSWMREWKNTAARDNFESLV